MKYYSYRLAFRAQPLIGSDFGTLVAFTAFLTLVRIFISVSVSESEPQLCAIVHRLTLCLGARLCPGVSQKELREAGMFQPSLRSPN